MRKRDLSVVGMITVMAIGLGACGPTASVSPRRAAPLVEVDAAAGETRALGDLKAIEQQVSEYYQRYGELPTRLPDLRETPDGVALIEEVPLDPWRAPYVLRRFDRDVVIYSAGPDLIIGSDDDVHLRMDFEGVSRSQGAEGGGG